MTCESCKYWERYQGEEGRGGCHRYPPQIVYDGDFELSSDRSWKEWPNMRKDEWCGEHQPKEDSQGEK